MVEFFVEVMVELSYYLSSSVQVSTSAEPITNVHIKSVVSSQNNGRD